jgi:DNA-binding PadR family transcriptional regulator
MTMVTQSRRSPLALAILALLDEEPMHPYRMQQLIKERDKDDVVNVRSRASLYQTIERLLRDGLIAVQETTRAENFPERTIYRLTDSGRETVRQWLRAMLATPAREFPEFPAALAHLPLLSPEEVCAHLEQRATMLEAEIAGIDTRLRAGEAILPRLFLVESHYLRAMRAAELQWVRAVIADLRGGAFTWDEEWLRDVAERIAQAPAMSERRLP